MRVLTQAMAGKPPPSLDALFKSKAKKKPKSTNLNAERPPSPPKPILRRDVVGEGEQDEGWQRALRQDEELLKACGLRIKEVEADGACLFRAFADQLEGNGGEAHASYRERCVDFLRDHRADFEPFLDEDFEEYCARMREPATWGGEVEAQALARSAGVNLLIYQPSQAGRPSGLVSSTVDIITSEASDCRCLQLSFHPTHHHGHHYNSVRCVDDEGSGPAIAASATELRRRIDEALNPKAPELAAEPKEEEIREPDPHAKMRSKTVF